MPKNVAQWYALQVHSRLAAEASATLRGQGYEEFLPAHCSPQRWSDRVRQIGTPLVPGYLFCRLNPGERVLPILNAPGVIGIVSAGNTPVPVDECEIEALRTVVRSGLSAQPWPFPLSPAVGKRIYIEDGPLAGLDGMIAKVDQVYRLIVSITLLRRSVAVDIDRDWARPVGALMGPRAVTLAERLLPRVG